MALAWKSNFSKEYHSILCRGFPSFLEDFISLPILTRLKGIGLLCGTDYTPLFHNSFFYSRFDHSVGVALIVWNFTKDIKQTVAGLLHDLSTPAFSHVTDFKNGDALKQESTEDLNAQMIREDKALSLVLKKYGLSYEDVENYHIYPVADNDMPGLSADRLEYMYPSGAALDKVWNLSEIKNNYSHIVIYKNEKGLPELAFDSVEEAALYAKKFAEISLILQHNEDKIAMQLLADILTLAEKTGLARESDWYSSSEKDLILRFDLALEKYKGSSNQYEKEFVKLYKTFRSSKSIIRSDKPLEGAYNLSLEVKKRYVNPLVADGVRVSAIDKSVAECIENFLSFRDSEFGCLPYAV